MMQTDRQPQKDEWIQQAYLAFERDVDLLCREHTGKWVAYHGERQIALTATRAEAWQECQRCGLPDGECWVFNIQPIIAVESAGLGMTIEYSDP